jgi:hypothetical protein
MASRTSLDFLVERNREAISQVWHHPIAAMMGVASQEYLRMNSRTLSVHITEVKDNRARA